MENTTNNCSTIETGKPLSPLSPLSQEEAYIKSLSKKEYKAYLIAQEHLGMTFTLSKSAGYIKFINKIKNDGLLTDIISV
jgi:hypothetical protein